MKVQPEKRYMISEAL